MTSQDEKGGKGQAVLLHYVRVVFLVLGLGTIHNSISTKLEQNF